MAASPSDPYANIAEADPDVVLGIAERLEVRAAHPDQRAMLDAYLADIDWPESAQVIELGCGTGPVSRALAARHEPSDVLGIDPSPILVQRARELAAEADNLRFETGDARETGLADASFDVAIFHTALCHIPEPERALVEAHRILVPGGRLAIFDGD